MPSPFQQLCTELNAVLIPALVAAGYRAPGMPFDRHTVRYELKYWFGRTWQGCELDVCRDSSSSTPICEPCFTELRVTSCGT